jgi:preprotein translocase subunit SecG
MSDPNTGIQGSALKQGDPVLVRLAVRTVLVLAIFFFVVSLVQLSYLHWSLRQSADSMVPQFAKHILQAAGPQDTDVLQLAVAAQLESEAIFRRHENAQVTQMGHLWIRYLGSMTGMIIAVIGSTFILARVNIPDRAEVSGEFQNLKIVLASASPGLVLVILGCVMMSIAVLSQNTSTVTDGALYAPFAGGSAGSSSAFQPPGIPATEQ